MRYGIKTLSLLFTLILLAGCARIGSARKEKVQTIAFYNVENFYDTEKNSQLDSDYTPTGALQWTEERYKTKLNNIAAVIENIGGKDGAAILGIAEVENKQVLDDLLQTSALRKRNYSVIHYDSPDATGLDMALLYNPKLFKPTSHEAIPVKVANYTGRDIIQVKGLFQDEPITIYLNHWPPNNGNARLGESRRRAAASILQKEIAVQQAVDKDAKIIVMGDFDETPPSPVLEGVLKATGRPNPAYRDELYNTFYMSHVRGMGSYFSRGEFKMVDQIMVSKAMIDGVGLQFAKGSATIHRPSFAKIELGRYRNTPRRTYAGNTYLGGYSDHFPVYIKVQQLRGNKVL